MIPSVEVHAVFIAGLVAGRGEWELVALAHNLKRLHRLKLMIAAWEAVRYVSGARHFHGVGIT